MAEALLLTLICIFFVVAVIQGMIMRNQVSIHSRLDLICDLELEKLKKQGELLEAVGKICTIVTNDRDIHPVTG